jgi:hypothetical protein
MCLSELPALAPRLVKRKTSVSLVLVPRSDSEPAHAVDKCYCAFTSRRACCFGQPRVAFSAIFLDVEVTQHPLATTLAAHEARAGHVGFDDVDFF